jgi:hypothetical protein
VIDTPVPIDVTPLKGRHRVRVSLIWAVQASSAIATSGRSCSVA